MKILFFSSYFHPYISGLTTYPWKILNHFSKKHQITVLTFNHKKNKLFQIKNKHSKIVYLPYLLRLYKGFISPQSFFYFFKEIKNNDFLILNQPAVEGLFLTFLAKIFQKKVISLVHCFLAGGNNILEKLIFKLANFFVFFQLLICDKIVLYTPQHLPRLFYKLFKLKNKKIYCQLPPIKKLPINKNYLNKILRYKKNNKYLIGFVGRISQEKGLEYLIRAIPNIKSETLNIMVLFAGPHGNEVSGEYQYFLKIKKLLNKYKLNYQFLGILTEKKLGAFYKAIDLLVLPSINSTESFGMVQAEAMVLGTPVVATNLPGVNLPIKLTKMGILVEPKNENQLSKAILEIFKNRKKYTNNKLIRNAQKIFDIKKVYQFWDEVIKNEK